MHILHVHRTYYFRSEILICHLLVPRQPLQNRPSWHLGGWETPWSAEEMLDGQHQRVDVPAYARAAPDGLLQICLEQNFCRIIPYVSPTTKSAKGTEMNRTEPAHRLHM